MTLTLFSTVLGATYFLLQNSLGVLKSKQIVSLFLFINIFFGWIGICNPYVLWLTRLGWITLIVLVILNQEEKKNILATVRKTIPFSILGLFSSIIPPKIIFYLFAAGYDNSSHIGFLYRTWRIGSFEYGSQGNGKILPSYVNLANAYPSLQMESWASVLRIFGLQINSTDELLRTFFFFYILTLIALAFSVNAFIQVRGKWRYVIASGSLTLVFLSPLSSIFWSGFPPTIWGVTVSLFGIRVIMLSKSNKYLQLMMSGLFSSIVLYSYQLFFPPFIVIFLFLSLKMLKNKIVTKTFIWMLISFVLVLVPSYLLLRISKPLKSYVYSPGGIRSPGMSIIIGLSLLAIIGLIISIKSFENGIVLLLAVLVNGSLAGYLVLSAHFGNKGTYYPLKSVFFSLFLMITLLVWLIGREDFSEYPFAIPFRAGVLIFFVFSAMAPLQARTAGVFSGETFDLLKSANAVVHGNYAPFPKSCLDSVYTQSRLKERFDKQNQLLAIDVANNQSDLVTRWANSLSGRLDNKVIELGINLGKNTNFQTIAQKFVQENLDQNVLILNSSEGCLKP